MKNAYRAFIQYSRQFRKNWLEYLILFGGLDIDNEVAVVHFFRWIKTIVLQDGEIPFVLYPNLITILAKHPIVVISLLIELRCVLISIYGEFMLLLTGFREIGLSNFRWK
nr:glycerophosphoryl diester phosphodiesterase membrane domain-containing protein [Bifidobacterium breve]